MVLHELKNLWATGDTIDPRLGNTLSKWIWPSVEVFVESFKNVLLNFNPKTILM
jgi:hypothetical protein